MDYFFLRKLLKNLRIFVNHSADYTYIQNSAIIDASIIGFFNNKDLNNKQ